MQVRLKDSNMWQADRVSASQENIHGYEIECRNAILCRNFACGLIQDISLHCA